MTARELAPSDLPPLLPELLSDTSVIALVPDDSEDRAWAAHVAWELARAACGTRRIALIDAGVDHPALDPGAVATGQEGLVDAFEFGSSLTHVAREQEPDLYYIPVGTAPSDPIAIWSHERWQRLQRGFASQGAMLFLFLPWDALPHLAVRPDRVLLLARDWPAGTPVAERVWGVVREPPAAPIARARGARWRTVVTATLAVLTAVAASYWFIVRPRGLESPSPGPKPEPVAVADSAPPAAVDSGGVGDVAVYTAAVPEPARTTPAEPVPAPDTLPYTLQVAAFDQMEAALALIDTLDEAGYLAYVTPVRVGTPARLWHRVMVGAYLTVADAQATRAELWDARLVRREQGAVLVTPRTLEVNTFRSGENAVAAAAGLREGGIPGYIVAGPDGVYRLLVGAFQSARQAEDAASLLLAAGYRGTLVIRIGTAR